MTAGSSILKDILISRYLGKTSQTCPIPEAQSPSGLPSNATLHLLSRYQLCGQFRLFSMAGSVFVVMEPRTSSLSL